ncbi:MAG: T9SS type A sorting domain-containing protein [Flavobacterium sp.]|nr:T9SS type A sorting domain-containing protein [Flavobacterium sp.]
MKKIIFGCLLLNVLNIYSQAVSISTANSSATQLVNEFLGANNNATNATKSIGNGIGYFQNINPVFPFTNGIVISTGNVNAITGTTNVSGTGSNTTDANLQAFANSSGLTGGIYDASYLSYNFTAASTELSFDYIFASEDYGLFQCAFSDVVAFLLTDLSTGITTNIAVVPGTTLPVLVTNIRNSANNGSCTSVNPQFFDVYSAVNNPSINGTSFNGRTVVMTAFANLNVGNNYKLKLVIGDYQDALYDTAVFIKASPTPTNVLGADLTIANNTAICSGQSYTLNTGLSGSNYNFQWFLNDTLILGAIEPTFTVNQAGVYKVVYQSVLDQLEYSDEIVIENPVPVETFPNVTSCGGYTLPNLAIGNYYYTEPFGVGVIIPTGSLITASMTIYVYNGCDSGSFVVTIFPAPNYSAPQNMTINEPDSDGIANFDLTSQISIISNGLSPDFQVEFYLNLSGATNANPDYQITNISTYINNSNPQTIYTSVTNLNGCGSYYSSFTLNVVNTPAVVFQSFIVYEPSTDGIAIFDLTAQIPSIIGVNANPADFIVAFFTSPEDANNNVNSIQNPSQFTNTSNPQTIYVRVTSLNGKTMSTTFVGTMQLSVQEALSTNDFKDIKIMVSPNPVVDFINISSKEKLKTISIYNVLGQIVFNKESKTNHEKIDLSTFSAGNYFLKVNANNNTKVFKIVKQ